MKHVWIVTAHYTEDSQCPEPSEILSVCPDQDTALAYRTAWESSQSTLENPNMYVNVTRHPVTSHLPPKHYFAMEWNEVLARMQVPCSDGLKRFYDKVLPTRISVVLALDENKEKEPSCFSQVLSQTPLVLVWYGTNEEEVIQQWKQYDNDYLKAYNDLHSN